MCLPYYSDAGQSFRADIKVYIWHYDHLIQITLLDRERFSLDILRMVIASQSKMAEVLRYKHNPSSRLYIDLEFNIFIFF